MRAMILAAGRGTRMRPLTDNCPKPLLKVGQYALIEHHIINLVSAGISEIIINHAWLGEQIVATLGNGSRYSAKISYSKETQALETAGGIAKAIDFFQDQPFVVINGDIWTDWQANQAFCMANKLDDNILANLVLVNNPDHNLGGDFQLLANGTVQANDNLKSAYTFAGIGVYQPSLFSGIKPGTAKPLAPVLKQAMLNNRVSGMLYCGKWFDIGTPDRLASLNKTL